VAPAVIFFSVQPTRTDDLHRQRKPPSTATVLLESATTIFFDAEA
jgi:hypothetical protein